MTTRFRGHFDGKVIIPDEPVDFPIDVPLEFTVRLLSESELSAPAEPGSDVETE